MITIPPIPPTKRSGLDIKSIIKLVSEALVGARKTAEGRVFELERTKENKLDQLFQGEIILALNLILNKFPKVFVIMRAGHTKRTAAKPASLLTGYEKQDYEWQQWKEAAENTPIILALMNGFNNWCEAQLHMRNITLKNLSEQSRQKVLDTVAAVYQQFELTSNPNVSIRWGVGNETGNLEARRLAIEFLENKEVVLYHKFHYEGAGYIEVEIKIKEFFRIRDELLAFYAPATNDGDETSVSSAPAVSSNPFASMKDLRWQDVSIQFLDGHNVRISAKDTNLAVDYRQMGFEDARTRLPNTQWALMNVLAEKGGQLGWENSEAADNIKKRKQVLSDTLKAFFQIDDDPFYPYRDEKAYRTKFTLKAEGD